MSNDKKQDKGNPQAEANAPQAPENNGATAPARNPLNPQNRYGKLFSGVQFQTAQSGKTYPNSDGSVSKKVANGLIILNGGFAGVGINVYARKASASSKKITVDVSFVGGRGVQAINALDEPSKMELAEYKQWLAAEYTLWRKGQGVATTTTKIANVELDDEIAAGIFDE